MSGISRHSTADLSELYSPRTLQLSLLFLVALAAVSIAGLTWAGRGGQAQMLLLSGAGFALLFFPRAAFFMFLVSLSLYIPHRVTYSFSIHPFDLMMAILFFSMVLDFLLRARANIRPALFDFVFLALILATVVSTVFAFDPGYSVVPLLRIVVVYLAFRAVFKFGLEVGTRKIILFFIYMVSIQSVYNTILFLLYSGKIRVFGLTGLNYETFAMIALPMALAFLVWSGRAREKLKFGIICLVIGFGILATQSRAPLLAVLIAIPILAVLATVKARREKTTGPLRTMKIVFIPVVILATAVIVLRETLFAGSLGRYEMFLGSFVQPEGTVALRIIQWTSAIRTFLDNPLTGIGVGNFRIIHLVYPDLQMIPYFGLVKGMSAHNVVLHYLAETGLLGGLALIALGWKGLRTGLSSFSMSLNAAGNQVSAALLMAMIIFCVTLFYMRAWTWGQGGYIMAIIFGLSAAWVYERRQTTAEPGQ